MTDKRIKKHNEYRINKITYTVTSVFKDEESSSEYLDEIFKRLLLSEFTKPVTS